MALETERRSTQNEAQPTQKVLFCSHIPAVTSFICTVRIHSSSVAAPSSTYYSLRQTQGTAHTAQHTRTLQHLNLLRPPRRQNPPRTPAYPRYNSKTIIKVGFPLFLSSSLQERSSPSSATSASAALIFPLQLCDAKDIVLGSGWWIASPSYYLDEALTVPWLVP